MCLRSSLWSACLVAILLSSCAKQPAVRQEKRGSQRSKLSFVPARSLPSLSSTQARHGNVRVPPNLAVANSPTLGPPNAPVTLTAFTDFSCDYCAQLAPSLRRVVQLYRGKVRLVFKSYPQNRTHFVYAQAAMAAHQQGRFWEYHDALFASDKVLTRKLLFRHARRLGLNMSAFRKALDSPEVRAHVKADELQGLRKGVRQVPTFFLNEKRLASPTGYRFFQAEINKLLLRKGYPREQLPWGRAPLRFDTRNSPILGARNAPLTLVAFLDFASPMCGLAFPQLRRLLRTFQGKVRLVFKYFPTRFQKNGRLAALAAQAAFREGRFGAYSQLLWSHPKKLERAHLEQYAQTLGLPMERFRKALRERSGRLRLRADAKEGKKAGVAGAPTLFLNGRRLSGFSYALLSQNVLTTLRKMGLRAESSLQGGRFQIQGSPTLGPRNARVRVVLFSDFSSSFGELLAPSIRKLARSFRGKVLWVFKHFPERGNAPSLLAARASMAAHAQGKFWAYHDLLFANTTRLQRRALLRYATRLGLDRKRFQKDMKKSSYLRLIERDQKEAKQYAIIGAPTVYINGVKLAPTSARALKRGIEKALKKK